MGKLFIDLKRRIAKIARKLDNISSELSAENITFADTKEIKKELIKIEPQVNKITNSMQNNTFSDLQTPFVAALEKLETIKNKLKELQSTITSDQYSKKSNKLYKSLKNFNSYAETFSECCKDSSKNKELLIQLKICKKHIKDSVVNDNVTVIEPEIHANLNETLVSQTHHSQPKLSSL